MAGYLHDFMILAMSLMLGCFHLSCAQHWWISLHASSLRIGLSGRGGRSPLETIHTICIGPAPSKGIVVS